MPDISGTGKNENPGHGPWGHRDEDLLSNKDAEKVFFPARCVKAAAKQARKED